MGKRCTKKQTATLQIFACCAAFLVIVVGLIPQSCAADALGPVPIKDVAWPAWEGRKVTMAVLNVGATPVPEGWSEILQAELTASGGIDLVEREKIGLLLQEQKLSLAGLTDEASAIAIGRMAGADGLVLLDVVEGRDQREVRVRLVDTRIGIRLWNTSFPADESTETAASALAHMLLHQAKIIRFDPEETKLVALTGFRREDLSVKHEWAVETLNSLVSQRLRQAKNIVLLEREQTLALLDERQWTNLPPKLQSSSFLIDGSFRTAIQADGTHIEVEARCRRGAANVNNPAHAEGNIDDLATLATQIADLLLKQLETRADTTDSEAESTAFAAEALYYLRHDDTEHALTAAEAALALEPENSERQQLFLISGLRAAKARVSEGAKTATPAQLISGLVLHRRCLEEIDRATIPFPALLQIIGTNFYVAVPKVRNSTEIAAWPGVQEAAMEIRAKIRELTQKFLPRMINDPNALTFAEFWGIGCSQHETPEEEYAAREAILSMMMNCSHPEQALANVFWLIEFDNTFMFMRSVLDNPAWTDEERIKNARSAFLTRLTKYPEPVIRIVAYRYLTGLMTKKERTESQAAFYYQQMVRDVKDELLAKANTRYKEFFEELADRSNPWPKSFIKQASRLPGGETIPAQLRELVQKTLDSQDPQRIVKMDILIMAFLEIIRETDDHTTEPRDLPERILAILEPNTETESDARLHRQGLIVQCQNYLASVYKMRPDLIRQKESETASLSVVKLLGQEMPQGTPLGDWMLAEKEQSLGKHNFFKYTRLLYSGNGKLWVAVEHIIYGKQPSCRLGLLEYDLAVRKQTRFLSSPETFNRPPLRTRFPWSFTGDFVCCMSAMDNTIILGLADNGLCVFDTTTGESTWQNENNGLPSNMLASCTVLNGRFYYASAERLEDKVLQNNKRAGQRAEVGLIEWNPLTKQGHIIASSRGELESLLLGIKDWPWAGDLISDPNRNCLWLSANALLFRVTPETDMVEMAMTPGYRWQHLWLHNGTVYSGSIRSGVYDNPSMKLNPDTDDVPFATDLKTAEEFIAAEDAHPYSFQPLGDESLPHGWPLRFYENGVIVGQGKDGIILSQNGTPETLRFCPENQGTSPYNPYDIIFTPSGMIVSFGRELYLFPEVHAESPEKEP